MPRNILLVEPDASLAEEIRRAFGPAGFSVTSIEEGEEALERARQSPPDLIVLAAELPDMSGFSVCNRLKRALAAVPLILCTSEATEAAIEAHKATRTHADGYLRKPFDLADLLGRAAELLQDLPQEPGPAEPPMPPRPDGRAMPPPMPARPPGPLGRPPSGMRPAAPARPAPSRAPRADRSEVLAEWPRDPAPPKGSPEEKLEFFRERLRARDAFFAKVRDAFSAVRSDAAEMQGEIDVLDSELQAERERTTELERKLSEAAQDAAARDARIADLEKQLADSEATRQSLSEVLNETMQQHEASEQEWAGRVAAADDARAKLEAQLAEEGESHAKAVAALEAERADERARFEAARVETEEGHGRALAEAELSRNAERGEWEAKLADADQRLAAQGAERDRLSGEVKRLETEAELATAAFAESRQASEQETGQLRGRIEDAEARAQAVAGELADANGRIQALEGDLQHAAALRGELEQALDAARREARAYEEKASAVEQAFQAKTAEHQAASRQLAELGAALERGRASFEGTRGELARIEGARADAERRAAQTAAERDQLARELVQMRRQGEAAVDRLARVEAEIQRLKKLEPLAEEGLRLRKEVATLREYAQQRSGAVENAARAAQAAAAEKARVEEQLAAETGRLTAAGARLEGELQAHRRRIADLENERAQRIAQINQLQNEVEQRRRALAVDHAEVERRQQAEVARLKAAMVDLERHLESRARAELQLKKRIQDLEKAGSGRPAADPAEITRLKQLVAKLEEDVSDLRGENEFLNGEVARYTQKNKELGSALKKKR